MCDLSLFKIGDIVRVKWFTWPDNLWKKHIGQIVKLERLYFEIWVPSLTPKIIRLKNIDSVTMKKASQNESMMFKLEN